MRFLAVLLATVTLVASAVCAIDVHPAAAHGQAAIEAPDHHGGASCLIRPTPPPATIAFEAVVPEGYAAILSRPVVGSPIVPIRARRRVLASHSTPLRL